MLNKAFNKVNLCYQINYIKDRTSMLLFTFCITKMLIYGLNFHEIHAIENFHAQLRS